MLLSLISANPNRINYTKVTNFISLSHSKRVARLYLRAFELETGSIEIGKKNLIVLKIFMRSVVMKTSPRNRPLYGAINDEIFIFNVSLYN